MRSTPVYAPDGMSGSVSHIDRFDDGLVHNHHWAVSATEAYPSHGRGDVQDRHDTMIANQSFSFDRYVEVTHWHDRHDDGLVHNHGWAASKK